MRDISNFNLLNIKGDCFDVIVASFANWLKGEYRYLFIDCLGFGLLESGTTIGEKIFVSKGDIVSVANKNGIEITVYDMKNLSVTDLYSLLSMFNPIVIEFNEYDCSWRKNYKKLNRKHFVLVLKYCQESEDFICIDTIPTDNSLKISQKQIISHAKKIICFSNNMDPIADIDVEKSLLYPMRIFSSKDKFGSIWDRFNLFIDDMLTWDSLKQELQMYADVDIVNMPLIWNLKNIQFSFTQYKLFLEYTGFDETGSLFEIIDRITKKLEIAINVLILSIIRDECFSAIEKIRLYLKLSVNSMREFVDMLILMRE